MQIQKNGKLYKDRHHTEDITSILLSNPSLVLFKPCEIAPDVTLRDVFHLLAQNLDFFDLLFPTNCKEIVNTGLECVKIKTESKTSESESDSEFSIVHLEVYWRLQLEFLDDVAQTKYAPLEFIPLPSGQVQVKQKGKSIIVKESNRTLSGLSNPNFHGCDVQGTGLGLDLTELKDIIDLPVTLNNRNVNFEQVDINDRRTEELVQVDFTLIQILAAIVWELSFFGTPAQKTTFIAKQSELIARVSNQAQPNAVC